MAASSPTHLPSVGETTVPGETFIFCNGIMNDFESAQASASTISKAFGGRQVVVYHNPTGLQDYFDHSIDQLMYQRQLAQQLAKKIHDFVSHHTTVTLFVHSHGAVITKKALEIISESHHADIEKIRVYAFGGATLIPNQLANVAQNYIFEDDIIADMGNIRSQRNMILYHVKHIIKTQNRRGISLDLAIGHHAYHYLRMELSPMSTINLSHEERKSKAERYHLISEERNIEALSKDPYFTQKVREYSQYFVDYHIQILPSPPIRHPEYREIKKHSNVQEFIDNLPSNLLSLAGNILTGLATFGTHALENHEFSAYLPTIHQIAHQPPSALTQRTT